MFYGQFCLRNAIKAIKSRYGVILGQKMVLKLFDLDSVQGRIFDEMLGFFLPFLFLFKIL